MHEKLDHVNDAFHFDAPVVAGPPVTNLTDPIVLPPIDDTPVDFHNGPFTAEKAFDPDTGAVHYQFYIDEPGDAYWSFEWSAATGPILFHQSGDGAITDYV